MQIRSRFFARSTHYVVVCLMLMSGAGCSLVPETRVRDSLHNPFPQLKRVAILPFFNQSDQPNVDGREVAQAYYAALQAVPGFEVLPVGVTETQWRTYSSMHGEPRTGAEFQKLAQAMGVEAIVVGSVTDFESYYPPRMAMTAHWYTANDGFHAIPPGYGLPWGTDDEDKIPARIVREAEFELARSQLATQSPMAQSPIAQSPIAQSPIAQSPMAQSPMAQSPMAQSPMAQSPMQVPEQPAHGSEIPMTKNEVANPVQPLPNSLRDGKVAYVQHDESLAFEESVAEHRIDVPSISSDGHEVMHDGFAPVDPSEVVFDNQMMSDPWAMDESLPANWPEPTDLIPDPPLPVPPASITQHDPVLSHTRLYRAEDPYFTERLADYVETGDDARGASWQGYIKRSDDFIRFCCHLHVSEMLEARGGRDPSDLILRWPVSRY